MVVAERDRLDDEQQHEERDRVVEDLDHGQASRALEQLAGARVCARLVAGRDRGGQRADGVGVGQLAADEPRVERQQPLPGHERVEREPVGEVVRALDHEVPERLVDRVADVEVVLGGEHLGARLELRPHDRARPRRAPARGVGADARAHLQHRALEPEAGRHVAGGAELDQQVEPAVVAPVAHPRRPALADPHEAGLLQPLERLTHRMPARPSSSLSRRSDGSESPGPYAPARISPRSRAWIRADSGAVVGPVIGTGCTSCVALGNVDCGVESQLDRHGHRST